MKEIVLCDGSKPEEISLLCKKYGISVNIDAFSDTDVYDVYCEEVNKNLMVYHDINITSMHGPYKDLCLGSKDKLISSATMERFENAYNISKLLKCPNIILHHGYIPGTSIQSNWIKRAALFFDEFLREKDESITIHLENQFEHSPDILSEVITTVNDKRLGICLDVGHANCNSSTPVLKWIEHLNKKISFVHLHNNNGLSDQHLDFSSGTMDFLEICTALEKYSQNSTWLIETNSIEDTEKSIQWLKDNHFFN
ncbi:MAG: sugar phosphate isomerase/epimerase [Hungatella sp.]|nr:sugar phosphate isomerase/epimerase [Hungatella sp.]